MLELTGAEMGSPFTSQTVREYRCTECGVTFWCTAGQRPVAHLHPEPTADEPLRIEAGEQSARPPD